ncbi:MAG: DUF4831 family protein [Dysgonamonadaceae bacterium]|jgi:hypothetical protein|nr:DUF4831 family protein [Dysgonamonadaceae bacterium]MDD4246181.1 DUF4831 family protein [Dysgonamonadaceae bacterium]MDD4605125.1 DUF4831 family protein [Dysgonamonadaceae bacterium]
MNTKTEILVSWIFFITLLLAQSVYAQTPIRHNALKSNDYGVVYSLPITQLDFELNITKTTYKRGEYYQYAKQYLNIDNPILEDKVVYSLNGVEIHNVGIPDKNQSYLIPFKSNTVEPYVYLTKEGLICAINDTPPIDDKMKTSSPQTVSPSTVDAQSLLTEEILLAGSRSKQAELIAKQIFALRMSRSDILTGEADNMPPDGNAYKLVMDQINMQEKALVELFEGNIKTEYIMKTISVIPKNENIEREVIFRFSEKLGLTSADDLAGEPVYLTLINKNPQPQVELTDKQIRQLEKKFSEGVVYNIPSKAQLTVNFRNQALANKEVDVVQYGSQDVLTRRMFDSRKQPIKVIFYPELGAIRQIIQ